MSKAESIFEDKFYTEISLPDDIKAEIDGDSPVIISVISSSNATGNIQRVRQAVRSTKSGKTHFAELHKIDDASVLYTKDIDAKKTARYSTQTSNIPDGQLKDFEKRFARESHVLPIEGTPELLSTAAKSPRSADKSKSPEKSSPKVSPRSVKTEPPKESPGKRPAIKWIKEDNAYIGPDDYVDAMIIEINKLRASRNLTQLVRNEDVMRIALQFAKKTHFPQQYQDLDFSKTSIPRSFNARMASWILTTDKSDPTEEYVKSLAQGNGEETDLGPFTDVGLGIVRVGKKFVFCRVYACLRPRDMKKIYEMTSAEQEKLMELINAYRKHDGVPPLNHSPDMTKRGMEYLKLLFTGTPSDSPEAQKLNEEMVYDRSYKQFIGGMSTATKDPVTEIFNALKKTRGGDLLDSYDDIGTTIVHDQFNHWSWMICLEKD